MLDLDEDDLPLVDAHQHFWDLDRNYYPWLCDDEPIAFRYGDYSALRRNYLPADYRRDTASHAIIGTVHVEAEWDRARPVEETHWLEEIARREGLPSAIVAHAALQNPDAAEILARQAQSTMVRGIRQKPKAASSPADAKRGLAGSMDDTRWRAGYAHLERHGLSFDLQTPWWHLDAAADLARDFPRTQIVINHTGLPSDRSEEGLSAWRRAMETLASQPNVAVKISGLGQPGLPWTVESNGPVIRDAVRIFGSERSLFASNYPVDSLVASFDTIVSVMRAALRALPRTQRRRIFSENAIRLYRLVHDPDRNLETSFDRE
jgi:predicted TIM-barrel fold metal-dependent hydrolase